MHHLEPNDHVRLTQGVPTLWLRSGETGVVVSIWHSPTAAYEVEFHGSGCGETVRTLLFPEQVELVATAGDAVSHGAHHE